MPAPANLVHQTATVTGTGDVTLTKVNGKQDFATAFTTGGSNVFDYFISNRDAAEWERGTGAMDTTNTLIRNTVIETHAGTTEKVSFSAGTKDVTNDVPALTQVRGTTVATSGFVPTFTTTGGNELQASGVQATTSAIFPATNDGVALGTSALKFSDLHLAAGGVVQFSTEATNITHAASQLTIAASSLNINTSQLTVNAVTADIGSVKFTTAVVAPITNDGVALGTSANKWADLHLASGAVVQFSTEGTNITHAASQLTVAASSLFFNTTNFVVTAVTADIGSVKFTTNAIRPATNDGVALGSSALKFSDLFLASGAVVQFSTEATSITHSASVLTIAASTIVTNSVAQSTAAIYPVTSEGVTLGTSTNRWAGVFTSSGVNFPAAADPSADANTLDDYEEGTFTPTFAPQTPGTFTIGYATSTTGQYTRAGQVTAIQAILSITTFTSGTGSGAMRIGGLPFANLTNTPSAQIGGINISQCTSGYRGCIGGSQPSGANSIQPYFRVASTGATSALQLGDSTTGANLMIFGGSYLSTV